MCLLQEMSEISGSPRGCDPAKRGEEKTIQPSTGSAASNYASRCSTKFIICFPSR